jgi:hypothetical protein
VIYVTQVMAGKVIISTFTRTHIKDCGHLVTHREFRLYLLTNFLDRDGDLDLPDFSLPSNPNLKDVLLELSRIAGASSERSSGS